MIESMERKKKTAEREARTNKLREKEDQPIIDEMTLVESMNKTVVYESQLLQGEEETKEIHDNKQNKKFYRELNQVLTASDVYSFVILRLIFEDYFGSIGC